MTSGLFDIEGGADATLTGIESRTLRAMLHLERRHVAILAETVGLGDVTTERVTQWERSKGRGYPPELVDRLRRIHSAVSELSGRMANEAWREARAATLAALPTARLTIVRPKGHGRIMTLLRLPADADVRFSAAQLQALDEGGGDFWQRLADAAVVEAAQLLSWEAARLPWVAGLPVHVELDSAADPNA